jgi:hypothetical protein
MAPVKSKGFTPPTASEVSAGPGQKTLPAPHPLQTRPQEQPVVTWLHSPAEHVAEQGAHALPRSERGNQADQNSPTMTKASEGS